MRIAMILAVVLFANTSMAQTSWMDSLGKFRQKYIDEHEVVKASDRERLQFYSLDSSYKVTGTFKQTKNARWFTLPTSGTLIKTFREYGTVEFVINDTIQILHLYQSQQLATSPEFADYLFVPFTDITNGAGTYEVGRYFDIRTSEIRGDRLTIDFNKAYSPYCSYVSGKYNCPIPPKENALAVAILAGERSFLKK